MTCSNLIATGSAGYSGDEERDGPGVDPPAGCKRQMIRCLDDADFDELPEYDLCIIGSGPAGATVARELGGRGLRIAVLESGGRRPSPLGDRLRRVKSEGLQVKEHSRERTLGGASTTWAGLSAPLDPIDLAPRPWDGITGWPIPKKDLLAWYERASERYHFPPLGAFGVEGREGMAGIRARGEVQPSWERLEEKVFLAADPAPDFGVEWPEAYEVAQLDVWLDATLLELEGEGDSRRVTRARVRSSSGHVRWVPARHFVLAAGGIENARVLLLSRSLWPTGLGNGRDQVGRCMMNHPKAYWGIVRFRHPVSELPYYFGCLHQGFAGYAGLRLREEEQRRLAMLNSYLRLEPIFPWTDDEGVESIVMLAKRTRGLLSAWKARRRDDIVELLDWSETGDDSGLQNARRGLRGTLALTVTALLHAPRVLQYLYFRLSRARPMVRAARVRCFMEMAPDPENRVVLSDERDEYDQPLPLVRHRPGTRDRRSLVELHAALDEELRRNGIGLLDGRLEDRDPWPIGQDASHHMGTTRMGTDPKRSVVNPDLRLHEVENVYLAGASVFPTGGCANPTYTIVALSIRLADHLAREVYELEGPLQGAR